MSFNYRIFKEIEDTSTISLTKKEIEAGRDAKEEVYTIREVYYDDEDKPTSYTTPYWPIGSTKKELLENMLDMQNAFSKPVLTIEDFK